MDIFVNFRLGLGSRIEADLKKAYPENPDGSLFPYREMLIVHIKSTTDVAISDPFTGIPVTYMQPDAIIFRNGSNIGCFISYVTESGSQKFYTTGGVWSFNPLILGVANIDTLFEDRNWGWYPQLVDGQIKHWSSYGFYRVFDTKGDGAASPEIARQEFKTYQLTKSADLLPSESRSKLIDGIVHLADRNFNRQ